MASGTVLNSPTLDLELLDYGFSSDDSPGMEVHFPLLPDLASLENSSSSGTPLCYSQPLSTSTPAMSGSFREKEVLPFSNMACVPHNEHSGNPHGNPLFTNTPRAIQLKSTCCPVTLT